MHDLSPENQLILNCATTSMDDEVYNTSLDIIRRDINWEYIFKTAKDHNVAPLMYPNLEKLNREHIIPQNILSNFRKKYHITGIRNAKMYNELAVLLKDFKENGIEVMLIKGAALAILVYKNIALRPMSDVDILIRKEDAKKVKEIMIENGYEEETLRREYFSELFFFLPTYTKPKLPPIEIKWGLFGYFRNGFKADFDNFSKDSQPIMINHFTVSVPSLQYLAEIAYCHIKKHKKTGVEQLLWYCDLAELEKNYGKEISKEFKLYPEEILEEERKDSKDLHFIPAIFLNIRAIDGIYKKFLYGLGCILPSKKFLVEQYKIKNSKLVYIYYIARPFILVSKALKSFAFKIRNLFLNS